VENEKVKVVADFTEAYAQPPLALAALAESPLLRCDLCKKSFKSAVTLASHVESAKHRKREAEAQKLSPAKRSPARKNLQALEQQANQLGATARAAQALYDVGMQYAQHGEAAEAQRCLAKCVGLLPPGASVPRVMIEVRARLVLARIGWQTSGHTAAAKHLEAALCLFHARDQSPLLCIAGEMAPWKQVLQAATEWSGQLRHPELAQHWADVSREWGSRVCSHAPSVGGAALLLCGKHYAFAATVFDQLKWHGHAGECLLLAVDWQSCVQHCLVHSNVMLLRKCAAVTGDPFVARLTTAVVAWDLVALDQLSCVPSLDDYQRATVRLALAVLSRHYSQ
jgi:hypothetical protein